MGERGLLAGTQLCDYHEAVAIRRFQHGDPDIVQAPSGHWRRPCMACGHRVAHLAGEVFQCPACGANDGWQPPEDADPDDTR